MSHNIMKKEINLYHTTLHPERERKKELNTKLTDFNFETRVN